MPRSLAVVRRPIWVLVVLMAAGTSGLTGCSAKPDPGVGVAPSVDGGSPVTDNPPGSLTCRALLTAVTASTLMTPGVVDAIARAGSTADAPVADSAHRLAAAYAGAIAARGTGNEPDAVAAVSAAGAEMSRVCADSSLNTVG